MNPIDSWWYACLQQGNTLMMKGNGWLGTVATSELHDDCISYLNKLGYRRMPHVNAFFRRLRQIAPQEEFQRKLIGPDRRSATTLPTLTQAREFFDKITRTNHDWLAFDIGEQAGLIDKSKGPGSSEEIPF